MKAHINMINDETGTNILIEYMFLIVIMAVLFSYFILVLFSVMNNSDSIIIGQELGVIGNDLANRIAGFSTKVNIYEYDSDQWESDVSAYSENIYLPELVGNKPYSIKITYDQGARTGRILVTYQSNTNINRTVEFRSTVDVIETTIDSTGLQPRIFYDQAQHAIRLVGS